MGQRDKKDKDLKPIVVAFELNENFDYWDGINTPFYGFRAR